MTKEDLLGWIRGLPRNPDLDLILLIFAALVFTVVGVLSTENVTLVLAAVLLLLAGLAVSQIRSRHQVSQLAASRASEPFSRLLREFPADLEARRSSASDVLLIGASLSRTTQSYRRTLPAALDRGARVRVLLLDPMTSTPERLESRARLRARIQSSLAELEAISERHSGLQIRLLERDPSAGFNVLDPNEPTGLVVVQHHEFEPRSEGAPILALTPADGSWFTHFVAEAERMWSAAKPWPPPLGSAAVRRHPSGFLEDFGQGLVADLANASEVLVTGISRNSLFVRNFSVFEALLSQGGRLRVLLQDPESRAVDVASQRYYAERNAEHLRHRIVHSRGILEELARITGGEVQLRYSHHPLSLGAIVIWPSGPTVTEPVLYLEYYAYRSRGEPKLVLASPDELAHRVFLEEAETLWEVGSAIEIQQRSE